MTAATTSFRTRIGNRLPGGAAWSAEGTNFSIFSHDAKNIELRLYEAAESAEPFQVIALDPDTQRTFSAWHVFVEQLPVGTHYTWRVQRPDGTWCEVLDPWAIAVSDAGWDRHQAISATNGLRGIVTGSRYDWNEPVFRPRGVAIFAKACFGHPSPSKRQKLNATAHACGAPAVLLHAFYAQQGA